MFMRCKKSHATGSGKSGCGGELFEFYRETCERLKELLKTKNDVIILSGEGILGLEAACASVIEPGDRVLCIDNGIFGNGFGDFVKMYGGEATYLKFDYRRAVDVNVVENFLRMTTILKLQLLYIVKLLRE